MSLFGIPPDIEATVRKFHEELSAIRGLLEVLVELHQQPEKPKTRRKSA